MGLCGRNPAQVAHRCAAHFSRAHPSAAHAAHITPSSRLALSLRPMYAPPLPRPQAYDVHWLAGMQAGSAGVQALGDTWEGTGGQGAAEDGAAPELEVRTGPACTARPARCPPRLPRPGGADQPAVQLKGGKHAACSRPRLVQEDILGGWDEESLKDLMGDYDDEGEDSGEFDDFDSPATDY